MADAFDLMTTYLKLEDGPSAHEIAVGPDFWTKVQDRSELHSGRLVCVFRYEDDWSSWEVHPDGDEIVYALSGAVDFVLDEPSGEHVVPLRQGQGAVVPRGVWHSANVREPGDVLHITRGAGTRHRPREGGRK